MKRISKLFKKQDGATAIEYGLIAALIAVALIVGVKALGTNISGTFSQVGSGLSSAL